MNRDFFFNPRLQFEPSSQPQWKLPEMNLSPNWAKTDPYTQFEPVVSSIVSSPVSNSTVSNDIVAVGEFGIMNSIRMDPNVPLVSTDPGFAERAAKFSRFGSRSFNSRTNQLGISSKKTETQFQSNVTPVKFPRVSSTPALKIDEMKTKSSRLSASGADSNEESSVSEQIASREIGVKNHKDSSSRKRKGVIGSTTRKGDEAIDDSKKPKKTEQPEAPKDYIHVRARRGQATDSHSLAERVRREKISDRMKFLENLVPNCNKVTGKALMLDEIINYVQSLQRQVEFLSMKLATVNPSLDFTTNDLISQHNNQSVENLPQQTSIGYHDELFNESTLTTQSIHEFTEHFQGFGDDDLQRIVQMGFGQNLNLDTSFFHSIVDQQSYMKTEL
ncbi:hypothetical protein QVD17_15603 [Tagetes erecta]|uniref:BHLH domain-containing protein n=1 Tax=Tagetes erecta TaxID=13708 RepID=A0AAD8KSN4_TARER|nr:hypothetical protein QVD17_15603 [Tagetes erecta]